MDSRELLAGFEIIADTEESDFTDFRPYVPAIDDRGRVAFQASVEGRADRLYAFGEEVLLPDGVSVVSHPAIDGDGNLAAYVKLSSGRTGLWHSHDGVLDLGFMEIGPLGPTMSVSGSIAFRGCRNDAPGIHLFGPDGVMTIAVAGFEYEGFEGLPVLNESGQVAFRANTADGPVVDVWEAETVARVAQGFATLGNFPSMNDGGTVAFAATRDSGESGIYVRGWGGGLERARLALDHAGFEVAYRGALLDGSGKIVVFATPDGATLGIYRQQDAAPLLCVGQRAGDTVVEEFALNSVSINQAGQLAVRVLLENGRQLIARTLD